MESQSPFLEIQRVETQIKVLLRGLDVGLLSADEKKAVANLRRLVIDSRLDIRDYELSETRDEQLQKAKDAQKRLAKLKTNLMAVGTMFGPADVAQIDAQLEYIRARLV